MPAGPPYHRSLWQLTIPATDTWLASAGEHFTEQYQSLDPDVYYVKLDDDTMYIGEHAIDMMLHEKLRDRFFIVSANVINHSGTFCLLQHNSHGQHCQHECVTHNL